MTKKQFHKKRNGAGKVNISNGLQALSILCNQLPSGETPAERSLWHYVFAFDTGDSVPLPGLPPTPGPWSSLAAFEAYVKTACGDDLASNPTWNRLMLPENIAARNERRRQVNQAIDLVFGPDDNKKRGANHGR